MSDQPSIGRIVHEHHATHGCLAAIIVGVGGSDVATGADEVTLYRFPNEHTSDGLRFRVPEAPPSDDTHNTWHWPERV